MPSGPGSGSGGLTGPRRALAGVFFIPGAAGKKKTQGTVILHLEVDTTGHPRINVKRHVGYGPDDKAVEAVGEWKFRPDLRDGKPVIVAATVEVNFRLQ